jgi:hypothetical protein
MPVCAAVVVTTLATLPVQPPVLPPPDAAAPPVVAPAPGAMPQPVPWPERWGAPPDLSCPSDAGGEPAGPSGAEPEAGCPPREVPHHCPTWPEVWGLVGLNGIPTGTRTAPNGLTFNPVFAVDTSLNIGLLPQKKLYLFLDSSFWAQRATSNVTNPHQGSFDFSKREFDVMPGLAWNYCGPLELRVFGYANNNLNRGIAPDLPYGYNDGVGFENRLYLPTADIYDLGKLSFLSIGYLPSNALIGLDGQQFKPGLFLRSYLTCDLPALSSYLYGDGQYFGEHGASPRLLFFDGGLAVRPFSGCSNLEFRVGGTETYDVHVHHGNALGYGAVRIEF